MRPLSDNELLKKLSAAVRQSRRVEADLVALIAEVDARKLYARRACPSMFAYCTQILHLSEHEAYLRIAVARASRKHPGLLAMLRDGRLHLAAIAKLAPHLTDENRSQVLQQAVHKSKLQVEELIAELIPRPDAPPVVRKLPVRYRPASVAAPQSLAPSRTADARPQLGPDRVEASSLNLPPAREGTTPPPSWPVRSPSHRPSVEPLAPARYRVQFTASAALREKLVRLQDLMRSRVPDGDLETLIDDAVTEKLQRLETKRFAKTASPRKTLAETDPTPSSRHIPAPVRRAVHDRDEGRCTYQDGSGRRCTARDRLEFHHHRTSFGRGGDHSVENLRLMCRTHNRLLAEKEYGKGKMARYEQPRGVEGCQPEARGNLSGQGPPGQGQAGGDQAGQSPTGGGDHGPGLTAANGPP